MSSSVKISVEMNLTMQKGLEGSFRNIFRKHRLRKFTRDGGELLFEMCDFAFQFSLRFLVERALELLHALREIRLVLHEQRQRRRIQPSKTLRVQ